MQALGISFGLDISLYLILPILTEFDGLAILPIHTHLCEVKVSVLVYDGQTSLCG